jgi:hypothetical protein
MVSPVDKNGGEVGPFGRVNTLSGTSSDDGNRVAFISAQPFADIQGAGNLFQEYVASRGGGGWFTRGLLPREGVSNVFAAGPQAVMFSSDLASYVLWIGGGGVAGGGIGGQDDPPLVAGEPPNTKNLFVRSVETGASQLVDVTPPGVASPDPATATTFAGATPDLSHVVFTEDAPLTANAPAGREDLFEWSGGLVSFVSVFPDGSPAENNETHFRFVSKDGSRVVFDSVENEGEVNGLYMREDGVRTVKLDASQGPGPGGGGNFRAASGDGSRVFFTADASAGLTNDTAPSTSGVSEENLYEYDTATGGLVDLTPSNGEADVLGVLGASGDGSYVYFVAEGVFATGATNGKANLYVWHEGVTSFIATLDPEADRLNWAPVELFSHKRSEISLDGAHLAFMSVLSLTGYDNRDANTGQQDYEVFLYDATTKRLVCGSCNPSGARPIGPSYLNNLPHEGNDIASRVLSSDGERVLFNSYDALVPQDTNGREDVYAFEDGVVHLISTGTSREDSFLLGMSSSGNDVFFVTAQPLVDQDLDAVSDVYDARVGGGFPAPFSEEGCAGEACRGAPAGAPASLAPSSAVFSGAGNLVPAPVPVVSAPKAKKPKPKAKHRRRKKKIRGRRSAHGARGGHSTGKRG